MFYVTQPKGFIIRGSENKEYKLRKPLYGLKQTPRAWSNRIAETFSKKGFEKYRSKPNLYKEKA